jgi:hypothetical protein
MRVNKMKLFTKRREPGLKNWKRGTLKLVPFGVASVRSASKNLNAFTAF